MRETGFSESHGVEWQAPGPEKAEAPDSDRRQAVQRPEKKMGLTDSRAEVRASKKTPERPVKPEAKESKERLTMRRFEYRDAEGNALGTAVAGFSSKEEVIGGRRVLELKSMKLQGFKKGKPTTVDILEKMNPNGVKIMLQVPGQEGQNENYYSEAGDVVVATMPDSLVSLGTLGHELGHAAQAREERFSGLGNADTMARSGDFLKHDDAQWERLSPTARQVMEQVPEAAKALGIKPDLFDDLDRIQGDISTMKTRAGELRQLEQAAYEAASPGTVERYRQEREAAEADLKVKTEKLDLLVSLSKTRELITTAKRILERDATKRSLQWMRQLKRDSGVNLFAETAAKTGSTPGTCEDSMSKGLSEGSEEPEEWTITDYVSDAKKALDSYGADKFRTGKTETSPGVMPMPGGDRIEDRPEDETLAWVRSKPETASPPAAEASVTATGAAPDAEAPTATPTAEAPLFSPEALQPTPPKPKKKGFFARLFGR